VEWHLPNVFAQLDIGSPPRARAGPEKKGRPVMTEQMPGELIYEYTIRSTGWCTRTVRPRWTLCCQVSQTSLRKGPGTTSRPSAAFALEAVGDPLSDAGKPLGLSRLASAQG
jgi:hypothetical protein